MDHFNNFLQALEDFVDARDDMWQEEKYSNVNLMNKILTERVEPAKEKMREHFNKAVQEAIKDYSPVRKTYFMEN